MEIRLHANARTTPKIRAYIQASRESVRSLSSELGVTETTIRRWKNRTTAEDGSHTRHNLNQSTSPREEEIIVELRQRVGLSLNDITEVMHRCVNPGLSWSAIHRCLQRLVATALPPIESDLAPKRGRFDKTEFGYAHVDLKHLTCLQGKLSYVFVAIERTTRFVYVEVAEKRNAPTIAACLERFCQAFPYKIHTILTDNGSEFTDRFAVCKIGKPEGLPSGDHPFDLVCKKFGIMHKLTKPFSPQTNGMVERFNRRISEAMALKAFVNKNQRKNKFLNHQERNTFLKDFVYAYNHTRLACLGYLSPLQTLSKYQTNQTELYT